MTEELRHFLLPEHTLLKSIEAHITTTIGELIEFHLQMRLIDRAKLAGAKLSADQSNADGQLRAQVARKKSFLNQLLAVHKAESQEPTTLEKMVT